jgi:hypothetical protein
MMHHCGRGHSHRAPASQTWRCVSRAIPVSWRHYRRASGCYIKIPVKRPDVVVAIRPICQCKLYIFLGELAYLTLPDGDTRED